MTCKFFLCQFTPSIASLGPRTCKFLRDLFCSGPTVLTVTRIFQDNWINTMAADALAPCITMPWAAMELTEGSTGQHIPWGRISYTFAISVFKSARKCYRQASSIKHTKSQQGVSCLVLLLSLPNPLKAGVKPRMKMKLEQRRTAMLQLHLSDQDYCSLRCHLY